jgi:hypothetical protein
MSAKAIKSVIAVLTVITLSLLSLEAAMLPPGSVVGGRTIGEWSAEWWKWLLPISTNNNPMLDDGQILPTNSIVLGKSIPEWIVDWHQWNYSLSTNGHPLYDTTGDSANNGQSGPIFFIGGADINIIGTNVQRTYTVPENTYLLLPALAADADNIFTEPPYSAAELSELLAPFFDDPPYLSFSINGVEVPNLLHHRHKAPVFSLFFETCDNPKTVNYHDCITGLIDPVVADGYWLMLQPLTPGDHVLRWFAGYGDPFSAVFDRTDRITVVRVPLSKWLADFRIALMPGLALLTDPHHIVSALEMTERQFALGHVRAGINHARLLQRRLQRDLQSADAPLAAGLVEYLERIIARAETELQSGVR